jgi:hypothetical protein
MSKMRQFYSGTRTGNLDTSSQLRQPDSQAIQVYRSRYSSHVDELRSSSNVDIPLGGPRLCPKADPIIHTHNPKGLSATSDKQREPFLQN